jgi:hypothetical protein
MLMAPILVCLLYFTQRRSTQLPPYHYYCGTIATICQYQVPSLRLSEVLDHGSDLGLC